MSKKTLLNLYSEYLDFRSTHQRTSTLTVWNMFRRMFGKGAFLSALESEHKFHESAVEWIGGVIKNHKLSKDDVKKIRLSLKMFKSEMGSRSTFLVIFTILFAASLSFYAGLSKFFGISDDIYSLFFSLAVALMIVFERGNVTKHTYFSEQLECLVDAWLDQAPDE